MSCLIITGMHRSGTSLISKLFVESGWNFGLNQIGPTKTNPHGHFEDIEFVKLHEEIFKHNDLSYLSPFGEISIPRNLESKAEKLVLQRINQKKWGWKDPRSTLFLEFWKKQVPSAKFLIVYRNPIEIVNSLLSRELKNLNIIKRLFFNRRVFVKVAAEACCYYFESFLKFSENNTSFCTFISVEEIQLDPKRTLNKLNLKLESDLKTYDFIQNFDDSLFKSSNDSKYLGSIIKNKLDALYMNVKRNSICN